MRAPSAASEFNSKFKIKKKVRFTISLPWNRQWTREARAGTSKTAGIDPQLDSATRNVRLAALLHGQNTGSARRESESDILTWFPALCDDNLGRLWYILSTIEHRQSNPLVGTIPGCLRFDQQEYFLETRHCPGKLEANENSEHLQILNVLFCFCRFTNSSIIWTQNRRTFP